MALEDDVKGTILVVDDDVSLLRAIERFLEHSGYQVSAAESQKIALELYQKNRPDVVLLDTYTKEDGRDKLTGPDTYREMKEITPGMPPVVAMSGYTKDDPGVQELLSLTDGKLIIKGSSGWILNLREIIPEVLAEYQQPNLKL
jgi:CheY-like chemotaxis protein